jgi:hypothetical protein
VSEQKHDGKLDGRPPGSGSHIECRLADGVIMVAEDLVGRVACQVYLDAKQALSLLAWLEQERATLEQLAGKI